MYKMISVIISLSLVLLSASNEGLVKKEMNSQSKLPKTEFVSKSDKNIESKLRSKTSARNLKSLNLKKVKNNISSDELKSAETENFGANSKATDLQKFEMGHKNTGNIRMPSFIQGPRANQQGGSPSLMSREHGTIFFSEYAEGSSNHKYLEIYNPTNDVVDLTQYAFPNVSNDPTVAGEHEYWNTFDDGASVSPGDVYVICHGSADASIQAECDQTFTYLSNGDDGFALVKGTEDDFDVIDVIGQSIFDDTYADPGDGWDVAGESEATKEHTLVRKSSVSTGNGGDWASSAGTDAANSEWVVYDQNTWDYVGFHSVGIVFAGVFDGTQYDATTNTYTMPTGAQSWAGFANQDASIYPMSFPYGGSISFTGSTAGTDASVYFRFEFNPYPNTEPSFNTAAITVTGTDAMGYVVDIPPQGDNTYSSFLLYVTTLDAPVTLNDVTVHMNGLETPYFSEGFENGFSSGWVNSDSNPWQLGPSFSAGPGSAASGVSAAYFDDYFYSTGSVGSITTEEINLYGSTAPELRFQYWDSGDADFVQVLVVNADGTSSSLFNTPATTLGWEEMVVDLSSYVGQSIKLQFVGTSVYGFSNPHLDDITVDETPTYPIALISTGEIDFGSVYIGGGSKSADFAVTNNGGGDLVGVVTSDNPKFTVSDMPATITPGQTATVTVTYTPTEEGADQGTITITHNGEPNTNSLSVSGIGSPNVLDENFDGPWTGDPAAPAGWQVINSDDDSYTWRQDNSWITGQVDGFAAYGSGNQNDWLISPIISLTGNQLLVWKDVVESALFPNDYGVYVFPGGVVDITAAVSLGTYSCTNTSITEHSINLSSYSGQDIRFAFHQTYSEASFYGFGIDDVSIQAAPEVPILGDLPTNILFPATVIGESRSTTVSLVNTGVGELSGTITYSDGFTGPATFTTETSADVAISYTPATPGIHSGTITITSNGGDVVVAASGNAGGSVATWDDDLNGDGVEDWPAGWEVINADGGNEWEFGGIADYAHSGTGYAYKQWQSGSDDWLVSPVLDVLAGDVFSFYTRSRSLTYGPEVMNVMLSTTGGGDASAFDVTLASAVEIPVDYTAYEYDLSAYVGTQIRVAIQCISDNVYYMYLDDIATSAVYQSAGPVIYEYPSSVDFGTVNAGETDSFLWDYYNTGGSDLQVTGVTFTDGPFSLSTESTLPVVTTSGGIGSFDIVFSPPAGVDSEYTGTMTVSHNAGDDIIVSLSGYGLDAVYVESFSGDVTPDGWQIIDGGGTAAWETNGTSQPNSLYHTWGPSGGPSEQDTAITPAIELPLITDFHYEIDFREYMNYGTDATYCGISVSTDGGATWEEVYEANYGGSSWFSSTVDLSGYSGTVHLAFVYTGVWGNAWGIDDIIIRSKPDPIIPILSTSSLVFPPTEIGSSSVERLYFMNIGAGTYEGSITYPDGVTGPASISGLVSGVMDSMDVTYTPTIQGTFSADIIFDGTPSNAASLTLVTEGNAGVQTATFEDSWIGWDDYSLVGYPSASGTPDTWTWYGGSGHSGPNFAGVYSYTGNWGGVNDFLVSPKLEVESGDVFSFWATGGYGVDCDYGEILGINEDSVAVWVSTEKPIMGMNSEGVDTGFVNTSAFTLLGEGKPSCSDWDAYSYDLSTYVGDAWLLIQSAKAGWMLKIDDVAYPKMYMNPNPVLYVGTEYDFGVTQPTGDSVRYYLRNTGSQDLIIDDMSFAIGDYFDVEYLGVGDFPVTISAGGIDSIVVYFMPEMEGVQTDTLIYYSNYTVGDYDAYGRGTDRSVFIAEAFNAPPSPVALIGPADETVLTIDGSNAEGQTGIFWTNSTDPDGYPIEYFLELIVENTGDTLDTLISQSNFFLSHGEVLEYMTEVGVTQLDISWNVYAYDGFEDVESSNGPWSLTIDGGWALSVDNNTLPEVFALHNNYPNPFNPITNIRYDVPELSDVKIDIYNVAGSKIKTLVSKQHQPGRYKIQWNATNEQGAPVATGMYIYKIRANDFVSVKKLLLMK